MVPRGEEREDEVRKWGNGVKSYKLPIKNKCHVNVNYSMVTTINNTVLYILKLLRELIFKEHILRGKKIVTMYGDRC